MSQDLQQPLPNQDMPIEDQFLGQKRPLHQVILDLAKEIQSNIDKKLEPVEQLRQLNHLLDSEQSTIQAELHQDSTSQTKREFYKSVFKLTAEKMLAEKVLSQQDYLGQILRFFRNILVNFFPKDVQEESLAEVVHAMFNLDSPLYTQALQSSHKKPAIGSQDEDSQDLLLEQKRIRSERDWRENLQVGSRLDSIMSKTIMNHKVNHWARATIVSLLDEDQFYVAFDNESNKMNKLVSRNSPDIALPDTYTDDFDWRYQISQDDIFDAMDSEATWYKSTCFSTRMQTTTQIDPDSHEDKPIKSHEVYIGFRIYEEEGHKVDDDGKKYTGWSSKYDEWITVTSPTIQKLRGVCKYYKIAGKSTMNYDNVVDDISDVIYNTKEICAWAVFRNNYFSNLRCIPDYFNEFGARGGFEEIIRFIGTIEDGQKKTLRHFFFLMEFLSKSMPLWTKQFSCYYIPLLKEALERGLLYTNQQNTGPTQLKFSRESLSGLQKAFQNVLRRFYTQDAYAQIMAELVLSIGFSLMRSEKLEQRIQGQREILEQIKGTRFSARKTMTAKEVMRKLKQENIFENIFGDNYHIQLIQRSQEIIKFYINEKEITEKEIDHIWSATKKDQQTKMEIYKIISDIAIQFKDEEIKLLVDRFAEVPPEQFVEKEIECVYELSKYSYKQSAFSVRAAQLFWDIAVQERPYKSQIVEIAIEKFIELGRNWDRDVKHEFIFKCVEKMKNNHSTVQCIKILQKLLDSIPNYKINNQPTLYDIAHQLVREHNVINLVIFDLALYSEQANELWAKGIINEQNIETQLVPGSAFSHRSQSHIRLNFIRQMLQNSQTQIEQEQLDQMWDIMLVRSKISIDSDVFFNWLKQMLGDNNKLSPALIAHFFQTKVCSGEANFKFIKKAGFDCIQNIFLNINEQEDRIQVLSLPNNNSNSVNTKLDFKLHTNPSELEGIDLIWKLFLEINKKDLDLTAAVIDLVTKIYHNLSPSLEAIKRDVEDQFCREALSRLVQVINDPKAGDEEKKSFTHIFVISLKSFFQDSEKYGFGSMRTHLTLDRGDFLQRIVIQNNITSQKNTPKYLELNVYSNMTIWALKALVADKLKQSPLKISLNRQDQKKKAFNDAEHSLTLRDYKVEPFEIISASKRPLVYTPRVPLLNKKKELVPEAKAIFESWFDKFSDEEGFMTPDSCVDFIRSSTQDQTVNKTDSRIVRLFNEYDKDIDGKLSREEFLEFYRDRAATKSDLVWSNLNVHGFGNDLKPQNSFYQQEDPNEVKDQSQLPRYKLSDNLTIFQELFTLFDKLPPPAQDDLWTLILNLRTNSLYYAQLLTFSDSEALQNAPTVQNLLYQLQILEYLLNEYQQTHTQNVALYFQENTDQNQFPTVNEAHGSNNQVAVEPQNQQMDNVDLNEQVREQQSAAPQSGVAIPLPPPLTNANMGANPGDVDGQPIGPQPPPHLQNNQNNVAFNTNEQKVKDMLDNFKGNVVQEVIKDDLFSKEELQRIIGDQDVDQLKANWVRNFIEIGAFKILLGFLAKLNSTNAKRQEQDILKSKTERECLFQILKILKILLLSSFLATSPSSEIGLELSRKMSSNRPHIVDNDAFDIDFDLDLGDGVVSSNQTTQKKTDEPKKSSVQQDQEDTAKTFEPLIHALQGELSLKILTSIDFKSFQEEIILIIQMILRKKEKLGLDDRQIIEQGLNLWISLLVYNHDLLQMLYDNYDSQRALGQKSIMGVLLEEGLLCGNYSVRECFKNNFTFIYQNIKSDQLKEQPYQFFLRMLLENIDLTMYKGRESKQFFVTLRLLLQQQFQAEKIQSADYKQIFESDILIQEYIARLYHYESKEKKSSFLEDTNLVGYIQVLQELIQNYPQVLNKESYWTLISRVIEKDLFTFNILPLEQDITKDIDIGTYEKPFINKCFSFESRKAAYDLLTVVCTINPDLVGELIATYWHPLVFKVKKPKKSGYAPKTETRSFHGFSGIKNLGCICYMNAMIQQFFHIPALRYLLLATEDKQPPNYQNFEGDQVDDNMLHQLIKLFGFLELTERQDYNPREFCFSFKDFAGQPTNVRIQQDSQEFLNLAFDRIEHLLASTSQKYLLQSVFGGETCSMMICKGCGNLRQRTEDFYNLSLEVKNQKSIYDGLKKFITGETINDFQCEACNQRVDVERKTVLSRLPNMLIIHLQRIVFDFDTLQNQKLNSRVEFPNVLNLKQYMVNEVLKQEKDLLKKSKKQKKKQEKSNLRDQERLREKIDLEEGKDESNSNSQAEEKVEKIPNESPTKNQQDDMSDEENEEEDQAMLNEEEEEDFQYKLVGVILHMGTADAGHYLSYININRGVKDEETPEWLQTEKETWLEFNDSQVKVFRFANLEEECFGGLAQNSIAGSSDFKDYSKNAYMLLYEKRRKEKIKVVIPQELAQSQSLSSLGCDGTAIPRAQSNLIQVCPQLKEINQNQIQFDHEKQESYVLVDFNSPQKFVPNNVYKMVHNDNHLFQCERQIFNNTFFDTTKKFVELLILNNPQVLQPEVPLSGKLYEFMDRLIFDLLLMTSENKALIEMAKVYTAMLDKSYDQTLKFISERILVDKSKLEKDQRSFFEALIANLDRETRDLNGLLLLFAVNKLFHQNNIELIDTIMNQVLGLMPDELCKNWLKISQYLEFIFLLTISGYPQLCYMIDKKIISKLIDFFMENESPYVLKGGQKKRQLMGSNYATPPLENAILTISWIARKYIFVKMNPKEPDGQHYSQITNYPCYLYMPMYQAELPPLSDDDIFMLSQKAFYNKNLKSGYAREEFGRLIGHLSYGNEDFARRISKRIIVGINKANQDEIEPYLHTLVVLLAMPDNLMEKKLEWILGIPYVKIEKQTHYQNHQEQRNQLKVGATLIDAANDDICDYRSTLFKTSSQVKESFLQILYQSRKRWTKYTLSGLTALMQVCKADLSGRIINYIRTMDPPTYQYGRYIDWIRPYIVDSIESAIRYPNNQTSKQEIMIGQNCLSYYDIIFPQIQQPLVQEGQVNTQTAQVLEYSSLDGGADLYMHWNIEEERVLTHIDYSEKNVTITAKEFRVKVSESKPNGITNLMFPANMFNSGSYNQQYKGYGTGGRVQNDNERHPASQNQGKNRSYGRGQNGDYSTANLGSHQVHQVTTRRAPQRNQRGGQPSGQKKKKKKIITSSAANQDEYQSQNIVGLVEDPSMLQVVDLDQAKAPSNAGGMNDQEGLVSVDSAYNNGNRKDILEEEEDDSQDGSMEVEYGDNDQNPGFNDSPKKYHEGRQDVGNAQDAMEDAGVTHGDYNDPQEYQHNYQDTNPREREICENDDEGLISTGNPHHADSAVPVHSQPEGRVGVNQDQFEVPDHQLIDGWEASLFTILVFNVSNNDQIKAVRVTLTFKDLSEGNSKINFRIPKSSIPCQIIQGRDKDIAIFTKLRPFDEEWGNYEFHLTFDEPVGNEVAIPGVAPLVGDVEMRAPADNIQGVQGGGSELNKYDEMIDANISEDKECGQCTYINLPQLSFCEMCGGNLK